VTAAPCAFCGEPLGTARQARGMHWRCYCKGLDAGLVERRRAYQPRPPTRRDPSPDPLDALVDAAAERVARRGAT
jgi:hypothetical protein